MDYPPSEVMLPNYIILYALHKLKKNSFKGDKIKHIFPKFFYIHQLQKSNQNAIQRVRSSDNLANLFTNAFSTSILKKLIGIHRLKGLYVALLEKI